MISPNSFFSPTDPETRRRQALARVYDFLLKLAEEKKNLDQSSTSDTQEEIDTALLKSNITPKGV